MFQKFRKVKKVPVVAVSLILVAGSLGGAQVVHVNRHKSIRRVDPYSSNTEVVTDQAASLLANSKLTQGTSFIDRGTWNIPGVEVKSQDDGQPKSLEVTHLGMAIVQQNGQPGQENPAVNLFGTRLGVAGDFSVSYELRNIKGEAMVSLYGVPPIIEDEFRSDQATLDVSIYGDTLWVGVTDKRSGQYAAEASFDITSTNKHSLKISKKGSTLSFDIDGKRVGSIAEKGIFSKGQAYFGFNAPDAATSYIVKSIQVSGADVQDTKQQALSKTSAGLAALATAKRSGFIFGTAVAPGAMVADSTYAGLLGNFNSFTTENAGKFQFVQPQQGTYNFAELDGIVDAASKAGVRVHGHTLVFGEANPTWLQNLAKNNPSQLKQVMIDHITTVVGRYKGRVASWDVINEPLAAYNTQPGKHGLRKHIWYKAMGESYIADALKAAHAADPNAELWINEYGMETDSDRFNDMFKLVQRLKVQGVQITGVGFQAHIDKGDTINGGQHIDINQLKKRFKKLATIGVKARISELDVSSVKQYPVFADVVSACIDSPNCQGVTIWGVTNKYSSGGSIDEEGRYYAGIGLPWDEKLNPLSPVDLMKQVLR